jgi:hypothetical protein
LLLLLLPKLRLSMALVVLAPIGTMRQGTDAENRVPTRPSASGLLTSLRPSTAARRVPIAGVMEGRKKSVGVLLADALQVKTAAPDHTAQVRVGAVVKAPEEATAKAAAVRRVSVE